MLVLAVRDARDLDEAIDVLPFLVESYADARQTIRHRGFKVRFVHPLLELMSLHRHRRDLIARRRNVGRRVFSLKIDVRSGFAFLPPRSRDPFFVFRFGGCPAKFFLVLAQITEHASTAFFSFLRLRDAFERL